MGIDGDAAAKHVANVERPAEYMVKCKEFDHCIDLVESIGNCKVTYNADPLKMANETIDRMRMLVVRAVSELKVTRSHK